MDKAKYDGLMEKVYFKPKFDLLPEELRNEIIKYAQETTIYAASKKYWKKSGMSMIGLDHRLHKLLDEEKPEGSKDEIKLTPKEKLLLKKLGTGEADFDDVSRMVAVKVFEKMLKRPWDFKFIDFFRTELLKIKKQEVEDRHDQAMAVINRLFMGQLPPQICPGCGRQLYEIKAEAPLAHEIQEGVIIPDGSEPIIRET